MKEKLKQKKLEDDLKIIYNKIRQLSIKMGFLYNYCRAYADKDGIHYFTPFVEYLDESLIFLGRELFDIVGKEPKKVEDRFLKNITPLDKATNIIIED